MEETLLRGTIHHVTRETMHYLKPKSRLSRREKKGRVVPHGTGGKPQKCLVAPFFNSLPLFLRSKAVDLFIGERNHLRVVASVH